MLFKRYWPILIIIAGFLLYLTLPVICPLIYVKLKASFPHPKATLGLPTAAIFALLLTSINLEKEEETNIFIGWRAKNFAGRIYLWLFVFLSLSIAIQVLW